MIGTRLADRYELMGELGRGGMAVVYRARDPRLERDVAIKMVSTVGLDPPAVERFQREARTVAGLDHPSIVPIYDFGHHHHPDGRQRWLFFVMPVIAGHTLRHLLRARRLPLAEVLEVAARVAEALEYSSSRGVVHRDIKPENVMVALDGEREPARIERVWVMDFGLSLARASSRLTRSGNLPGTLSYLSPEQVRGEELDGRCDLYSLATILYESTTGRPPFFGSTATVLYRIAHEPPPPLPRHAVDRRLAALIESCLAKNPADRPASGLRLAAALRGHARDLRRAEGTGIGDAGGRAGSGMPGGPDFQAGEGHQPGRGERAPVRLVGRVAEREALRASLEQARAGHCRLVLLCGERGMGKSRLLAETESEARARGVLVLRGRFSSPESGYPYEAFGELVRDYFRPLSASSSVRSTRAWTTDGVDLDDLAGPLLSLFPMLGDLEELRRPAALGIDEADRVAPPRVEEPDDPRAIFELLARVLVRLADGRALMLSIEQLHWATTSVSLLQFLLHRLATTPLLVVGTFRRSATEKGHPIRRLVRGAESDPRCTIVEVGPLDRESHRALVAELLPGAIPPASTTADDSRSGASLAGDSRAGDSRAGDSRAGDSRAGDSRAGHSRLGEGLARRLYEVSEGNPFFTEELVRGLDPADLEEPSSLDLVRGSSDSSLALELPESIRQAVEMRLERLTQPLERLLGLAAVLGRRFEARELEALAERDGILAEAASEVVAGDGTVTAASAAASARPGAPPETGPDTGVQQLVARGLLDSRRERGHDWLAFPSALVREVVLSRMSRRRRRRWHARAGRLLEARYAGRTEQVLARLLHLFYEGDAAEETVRYGHELARRSLDAHGYEEAERAARAALELLEEQSPDPALEGSLRRVLARALAGRGAVDGAGEHAARAVRAFEAAGDPERAADTCRELAEIAWRSRRLDAMDRWLEDGTRIARRGARSATLARLLTLASTAANLRSAPVRARRLMEEARGLLRPSNAEAKPVPRPGPAVRIGQSTALASVDPALCFSIQDGEVLSNLYEPLVTVDDAGSYRPTLCRTISCSGEGRVFGFQLRENLEFSDGTPVDARRVARSLVEAARIGPDHLAICLEPIVGAREFFAGEADDIEGIRALGELELEITLREPLAIFPALLSPIQLGICLRREGQILGTGPFVLASGEVGSPRVCLDRNPRGRQRPTPKVAGLEYLHVGDARAIAEALRRGEIDMARDLSPRQVESFLASPTHGSSVYETVVPNVAFVLLNVHGPRTRDRRLRRVLAGVLDSRQLVWRAMGRFALPATGWIPPGMLGYEAEPHGPRALDRFAAVEAMQALLPLPIRLRAFLHPAFADPYRAVTEAILDEWSLLGIEVEVEEAESVDQQASALERYDLVFSRWLPDYADPDAYCQPTFHRRYGVYGGLVGSAELDRLAEEARREADPAARQRLYRRFQLLLLHEYRVLPLFHDVEHRVASPRLGGVRATGRPPFVDFARLGWLGEEPGRATTPRARSGHLRVPLAGQVETLDPVAGRLTEGARVAALLFETLMTVDESANVVPHLARSVTVEDGGAAIRFDLRAARFHDGRQLTCHDVRDSFRRLLDQGEATHESPLAAVEGAAALRAGEAHELAGFQALSQRSFRLHLARPAPHLLALLAAPSTAILPEGTRQVGGSWRTGCVGTGPFRLVDWRPGASVIELEAHPEHWRPGLPRCESLRFEAAVPARQQVAGLVEGRYHLLGHLSPADLERFALDPTHAAGLVDHPAFATHFVVFNRMLGPMADPARRRSLARLLRAALGRHLERLGRAAVAASSLLPPGLAVRDTAPSDPGSGASVELSGTRLVAAVDPSFLDQFGELWSALVADLGEHGVELGLHPRPLDGPMGPDDQRSVDLAAARWAAAVPDPTSFASLLHSEHGLFGRWLCHGEVDRTVERGREEADPIVRASLYQELESLLEREALVQPLFHEQGCWLAAPGVEGLELGYGWPGVTFEKLRREEPGPGGDLEASRGPSPAADD